MATVFFGFTVGATTTQSTKTVNNTDGARILAAEKITMGTSTDQATVNALLLRWINDMIGDTKSVERAAVPVSDIPVT